MRWRSALSILGVMLALGIGVAASRGDAQTALAETDYAPQLVQLAQAPQPRPRPPHSARSQAEARHKELINSNTVGLAAGRIEGAPLRFAAELARVLDDGDQMRVLPIVTRGPFDNVFDLLYLRGVDIAIVYGDVLEHFKKNPEIAGISRRINYIASLFPSELHIFVRPEINSLKDLEGKPVNFNTKGTAAAYSGPIILERLGIKVDAKFDPHTVAMQEMKKSDKYAATVWVSSKPLAPFLKGQWPEGFKFISVPYVDSLEYYSPAYLEHDDYPALIPQGQRIATVAVPAVLAAYDWPADTERHRRMVRFVDYLFERLPKLQNEPGYHKTWKDVNLGATVPGWKRFEVVTERLAKAARERSTVVPSAARGGVPTPSASEEAIRSQSSRTAPENPAEQERLFRAFLEWRRHQQQ